jgi:branched-chain amino acid transport system substrate-binding protein
MNNQERKTTMNTTLRTAVSAALVAMGVAAAGPASAQAQPKLSGNAIRIGVLTDMSGLYSDISGQGSVTAAQMAVDDFIAANKPAYKIDVISADHQNKPDVGSGKAREWYDTQGVDLIADIVNSGVGLAAAKVAGEKKKLMMNTGAGSTRITNEDCNPYSIHWAYDTYALAAVAGRAIVQGGGKSWYFLTADYAFGQSLEQDTTGIIKANGGTVLGSVRHPLNASDFSSFLLQAQASKAQVIGLANAGGDTINAIKAANEFGITKSQSLAGLLVFISDVHSLGLNVAQGMQLTDGWYWDLNEETRKFGRRYFEKMKKMPGMVQAGTYSATLAYLNAVKAAGSDDSDAVVAAMKNTRYNDFYLRNGHLRDDNRMVHDMYLMQVKKPAESKYPWDYYHVKATVPGDEAYQPMSASRCPMVKKS